MPDVTTALLKLVRGEPQTTMELAPGAHRLAVSALHTRKIKGSVSIENAHGMTWRRAS